MPLNIKEPHNSALNLPIPVACKDKRNKENINSILNTTSKISLSQDAPVHSAPCHVEKTETPTAIKKIFFVKSTTPKEANDTALECILNEGERIRNETLSVRPRHDIPPPPAMNFTSKYKFGLGLLLLGSMTGGVAFFLHNRNKNHPQQEPYLPERAFLPPPYARNNISDLTTENTLTTHQENSRREIPHEISTKHSNEPKQRRHLKKRKLAPNKKVNTTSTIDDVQIKKLTDCYEERASMTPAKVIRIISTTLKSPVSSLIKEGRIVVNHHLYGAGCTENGAFDEMAEKIELSIQDILASLPIYGRARIIMLLTSSLLDMIADAIENKELSLSDISEAQNYIITLAKDLVMSTLTKKLIKTGNVKDIDDIIKKITFKKNKMYLNLSPKAVDVEVRDYNDHISDIKNGGYFFYTNEKKWVHLNTPKFMENIKKSLKKSNIMWGPDAKIHFLQNNGPSLYDNALLINHEATLYSFVDGELLPVSEIEIADDVFRYIVSQDKKESPIIVKQGEWFFEDNTSPIFTKNAISFFNEHEAITKKLVNKDITHHDVGPMDAKIPLHYDKNHNKYIKIKNDYYSLKVDKHNDYYLSGEYDVLPLKITGNKYALQSQYLDGVYACDRIQLGGLPFGKNREPYYLDNTIIREIKQQSSSWKEVELSYKHNLNRDHNFSESNIPGALHISDNDYLPYEGKLIKIKANGDDTFRLGNSDDTKNIIIAYKNAKSNTYYLMPKRTKITKNKKFNLRSGHCISKRQIFSLCNAKFKESSQITKSLRDNISHGIVIKNPDEVLVPYDDINGFYRKKNNRNEIYYHSKDNVYFHVEEKNELSADIMPEVFRIYGTGENDVLNKDILIEKISIIKDFDTHTMILATPDEAMNTIFGSESRIKEYFLNAQPPESSKTAFNIEHVKSELENMHQRDDMNYVHDLFDRYSKKTIISKYENSMAIAAMAAKKIDPDGFSDFKKFSDIATESVHSSKLRVKLSIFEESLINTSKELRKTIMLLENFNDDFYGYFKRNTRITDTKLLDFFKGSLIKRLKRMTYILNEEERENIIFIVNNYKSTGIKNGMTLGFCFPGDPMDRIFINAAAVPDDFNPTLNVFEDYQTRENYITSISNTMLHEAAHATGLPHDLFYINSTESLDYVNLEASMQHIEDLIRSQKITNNDNFIYLCKLYFASNPIYKNYRLDSLLSPDNLATIFNNDNYFKLILFLNNPDSISQMLRDFSKYSRL